MLNITKHGMERYIERIKLVPKNESKSYAVINRAIINEELDKMFTYSKFLYCGQFNNHNKCNYHMADDMILVLNEDNTKLITIYRADYGWGRNINKQIIKQTLEELDEVESKEIEALYTLEKEENSLKVDLSLIKEKIETYDLLIKKLKAESAGIKARISSIGAAAEEAKLNKEQVLHKLIYSKDYKTAIEDMQGA